MTVNIAVLPSLPDTTSLCTSPIYSESSTHPSSESSPICSLSKSIESTYPMLYKLIFLWQAIVFLPIWTSKQSNRKWQSSLPSSEGSSFRTQFQFGCVFQDNNSRVRRTRPLFHGQWEHNRKEWGPCSAVQNVLRTHFSCGCCWSIWNSTEHKYCTLPNCCISCSPACSRAVTSSSL